METKVKFVACDMPEATPFMLHIYAAVAQEEARAVSAKDQGTGGSEAARRPAWGNGR
jgi:molybdopterin-guanine dinucleotide biosynthesis protein A